MIHTKTGILGTEIHNMIHIETQIHILEIVIHNLIHIGTRMGKTGGKREEKMTKNRGKLADKYR